MINSYNTIIWDWNGTLFDDAWLAVEVMDKMLKERNFTGLTVEHYQELFDFPVKDYYTKLGFDFEKEPFEIVGMEFINNYDARRYECQLRDSVTDLLKRIQQAGLNQYVLSARNHLQLQEEIAFFGINQYFNHFIGLSDNYAHGKLDLGFQLIKKLQIDTKTALLIGDTLHDYEVANALGIDCVLIAGGHQSIDRLKSSNCKVIRHFDEI